jgi:uncharacterized membrane protein YfcA
VAAVTPLLAAAAVAVLAGAAVQAATGFGFAVLAAPLAFAALDSHEAIGLLLLLGAEIGVLTLATEGRRPQPMVRRSVIVLAWAVPAAVAGVAVLRALDAVTLQVAVSIGVAATLVVRHRAPEVEQRRGGRGSESRWAAPVTGLSAGALVTSTNTSGPPLLLYLTGRGDDPVAVRDTLTVCQLGLSLIGAAAVLATGTSGVVPRGWLVALFALLVALAHLVGRRVFARLAASGRYEPVLNATLVVAVAAGLATAVL